MERKLGQGRVSHSVRSRLSDREGDLDLPPHEFEKFTITRGEQVHLQRETGRKVPRVMYQCKHCFETVTWAESTNLKEDPCPMRS